MSCRDRLTMLMQRFLFGCLLAIAIAACHGKVNLVTVYSRSAASAERKDCRTITHSMGKTEICGQPQRIVVLGPYLLEGLLSLNVQPIAFADHLAFHQGDYTNPSQQIPYLGQRVSQPFLTNVGLAYSPSIEAILKAQPDLILGIDSYVAAQYPTLAGIAPTLLLKHDEPETNLKAIAQAVNQTEAVAPLLKETHQKIAAARHRFAPMVKNNPKVLLLSSSQLREIHLGNSAHSLCSQLLEDLGFQLITPPGLERPQQGMLVPISLETLSELNDADLIILLGSNFSALNQGENANDFDDHQLVQLKQAWSKNAIAQTLNASQKGQVYFIPAYLCLGLPGSIGTELYLNELKQQLLPRSESSTN